jgi:hypothetical protein
MNAIKRPDADHALRLKARSSAGRDHRAAARERSKRQCLDAAEVLAITGGAAEAIATALHRAA